MFGRVGLVLCATACALAAAGCDDGGDRSGPSATAQSGARFEEAPCATQPPASEPEAVRCGFAVVPTSRTRGTDETVRLAVMILKAEGAPPADDPVVYVSGGPGISALRSDLTFFDAWLDIPLQARRDIVIFDQRGTGFSQPALDCAAEGEAYRERLAQRLTVDEEWDRSEAIALACGAGLRDRGIDLADYRNAESAADIRDVMTALGYRAWNIYAFSYGARVALTAMRDDPRGIRAVVLDSPSPPAGFGAGRAADLRDAVGRVFRACGEDAACAAAYPAPGAALDGVLDALGREPVTLASTSGVTVTITAERFIDALFRRFGAELFPRLPAEVYAIRGGDRAALQPYADVLAAGWSGIASGALISTVCADDVPFVTSDDVERGAAGVRAEFVGGVRSFSAWWPVSVVGGTANLERARRFCRDWGVPPATTRPDAPVTSAVPAFVMSGAYDAGEPPSHGAKVAGLLSRSYFLEVPGSGHGVGFRYPLCAGAMAAAFLDAPERAPDAACLAGIRPIAWVVP